MKEDFSARRKKIETRKQSGKTTPKQPDMAPSPKRIDVKKTPPQTQPQTSQTTRIGQSTLAKA